MPAYTPTDHLSILSGIQPAELFQLGVTLSLAHRGFLDPGHIFYGLLSDSSNARQERLRSRRPFVPTTRNFLDNLAGLDIRASEWTNCRWKAKYCKNTSRLRVFIPKNSTRLVGMSWLKTAWVKLNCLRTGARCSIRPCTNGVSLLHQIASAAPLNKPRTTF